MSLRKHILLSAIFAYSFTCSSLWAISAGAGTTSAPFLSVITDARASSMGESTAALLDDGGLMFWNPAVLGLDRHQEVTLSTMKLNGFEDGFADGAKLVNAAGIYSTEKYGDSTAMFERPGNFGFSLLYADYGSVPVTTTTPDAEGSFTPRNLAASVYWGNRITSNDTLRNMPFGVGLKYIYQSLGDYSASGVAADLGTAYIFPKDSALGGFAAGLSILNLGGTSAFISEADPLPLTFKGGISYAFFMNDIIGLFGGGKRFFNTTHEDAIITAELSKATSTDMIVSTGMELEFYDMVFVRGGYQMNNADRGMTFGGGFAYSSHTGSYRFDFAWVPQALLGDNFRLTMTYTWGKTGKAQGRNIKTALPKAKDPLQYNDPFSIQDPAFN